MRIVSSTTRTLQRVAARPPPELTRAAKTRLAWMDHYARHGNVSFTCRHFGISRQTFYVWQRRYDPRDLRTLEARRPRPKRTRPRTWTDAQVQAVQELREQYPCWGKDKLQRLLPTDLALSVSAVGFQGGTHPHELARPWPAPRATAPHHHAPAGPAACVGGGSNFSGLAFPFLREKIAGELDVLLVGEQRAQVNGGVEVVNHLRTDRRLRYCQLHAGLSVLGVAGEHRLVHVEGAWARHVMDAFDDGEKSSTGSTIPTPNISAQSTFTVLRANWRSVVSMRARAALALCRSSCHAPSCAPAHPAPGAGSRRPRGSRCP